MTKINIICMKWGSLYNADYVNILYNSIKRNLTKDFDFFCFTDDDSNLNDGIIAKPLPVMDIPENKKISPWLKLAVYEKDFAGLIGKTLFLDLDVIIMDNIDCLIDYTNEYAITENWTQIGQGIGNSSVFCFNIGEYSYIYDEFVKDPIAITNQYDNEQIYASRMLDKKMVYYPSDWIKSFKRHSVAKSILRFFFEPKIPSNVKIIAFHGHPKPHEAMIGLWPKKFIPYMKKASWIKNYWF